MKKSVAALVLSVMALLTIVLGNSGFTGLQILDLPEPPAPPGMEQEIQPDVQQPVQAIPQQVKPKASNDAQEFLDVAADSSILSRLSALERKMLALDLLPSWEARLNDVEAKVALAANVNQRIDSMQSEIDSLKVDVNNLKQQAGRPFVDAPFVFEELGKMSQKNTILSITLSVLVLAIIVAMIITTILQRKKELEEDKFLIRQYLQNYTRAGYKMEVLRMHLRACGWKDKFVDQIVKELR